MNYDKYKAIVFDFDGTLYDAKGFALKLIFSDLIRSLWSKHERNIRKKLAGIDFGTSEAFYDEYFKRVGPDKRDWYFNVYLPLMANVLKSFSARPGAQSFIDKMVSMGKEVCVLSDYPMIQSRLESIGLSINPKRLWSTESFGALKPCARPFTAIAEALNIRPEEILMIGDRVDTDGDGANAAGYDVVLVKTKKNANSTAYKILDWDDIIKVD